MDRRMQAAFEYLILYLTPHPLLKSPRVGETLYLYLATSKETFTVVLVKLEGVHQFLVYYISRVLQNGEPMLKITPVLSIPSIKEVLSKVDTSGRVRKWSIELTEFKIDFALGIAIKGQVLADFIVKCSFERTEDATVNVGYNLKCWIYRLSFGFQTSNNISEYEALILGLQLAHQLGAKDIIVHTDS
ncbi:rve domain-containing protein/RVT_3 domain-containing protein [Gossypium australe]|uniref:Rve domain-containing protein/RVT_3 domain-containing protein n=1 Tax=Gossypium australe TaxID=47621 RepID=A0A5B6X2K5_9ROSI|nr:rve domain-containing protein/RVT_3 domain-containing protein [Gossypium australe]